ncbi:MAG: SCP2 sterol-binding domain-containing protein [Clostridium sp.]|nr:SCP2 sterol-binding domain-containing protein [Clostridium sp.]
MNINIYYGGRGLIDDPTLYVANKMQEILEELRVHVERYNLYEQKNNILTLPQTLKSADGVILATTIEWYGIGGYMQQFLDACWLYGDKGKIAKIYMCPVVMSTTYGEREGKMNLAIAWEILGGLPCEGICGYIADEVTLEIEEAYTHIIEKATENLYRVIKQKTPSFPASNQIVKKMILTTRNVDFTPQETEQLSQYVSDDSYVRRQKEDIQELASLFRDMLGKGETDGEEELLTEFRQAFRPQPEFRAAYSIIMEDKNKMLGIKVDGPSLECFYGSPEAPDVEMNLSRNSIEEIVNGRMTFQRAFMSGTMKMKGDFKILRTLDQIFRFEEAK